MFNGSGEYRRGCRGAGEADKKSHGSRVNIASSSNPEQRRRAAALDGKQGDGEQARSRRESFRKSYAEACGPAGPAGRRISKGEHKHSPALQGEDQVDDKGTQFDEIRKKRARLRKKLRLEQQASQSQDVDHWTTHQGLTRQDQAREFTRKA